MADVARIDEERAWTLTQRAAAEALGTLWLVLAGAGTAVLAGDRVGTLGIALAFGLAVLTMAYAVGHISGGLFNPAIALGLFAAGRLRGRDMVVYVIAQVIGAIAGAGLVLLLAQGMPGGYSAAAGGLAANGYGARSPAGFDLGSAFVAELLLTFVFVLVVLGVTSKRALNTFGGIAIGLCLSLIHLVSIPITNTSVNPARSTGPALFVGGWALEQLWVFWVAPLAGALVAAVVGRILFAEEGIVGARLARRAARQPDRPVGAPTPTPVA